MRTGLTLMMTVILIGGVGSAGLGQEAKKAKSPAAKGPDVAKADTPAPAELRAKVHRLMAALIDAQSAEKPDEAKIQRLNEQLQTLRQQIWAQGPPAPGAWQSPWGGPGMGYGRGAGWGVPGGRGWGKGPGPGRGYGPGPGWGRGGGPRTMPAPGRGPGWGRGPGRGYGPGAGPPGRGMGYGRQWGFVDEDRDGVCDNYERVWGEKN
jgi:hypothetical protein